MEELLKWKENRNSGNDKDLEFLDPSKQQEKSFKVCLRSKLFSKIRKCQGICGLKTSIEDVLLFSVKAHAFIT